MPSNPSAWVKTAISDAGAATAGPVGAILGRLAGGMLEAVLPGMPGFLASLSGNSEIDVPEGMSSKITGSLSMPDKLHINHHLQSAFMEACCEALYDVGGQQCFPQVWENRPRDVPGPALFPGTPEGRLLWIAASPLAPQVAECLQQLERAIRGQLIIPLDPPSDEPAASTQVYLLAQTPAELNKGFFEHMIWPFFARYRALDAELPVLAQHLQHNLLDRTLAHLGQILKNRTPAWRTFNRAVLEGLHAQVRELSGGQAETMRRLDAVAPPGISAELADNLAGLFTIYGEMEKEPIQSLDALAQQAAVFQRAELEYLEKLASSSPPGESRVERVLRFLEDGTYTIDGPALDAAGQDPEPGEPPFMGLHYFAETDAPLFFGRERLAARLAHLLDERPLLVVTGASGSGKSSLVRAGLIPALRSIKILADGSLPPAGADRWPVALFTPTAHPFDALAACLARTSESMREAVMLLDDLKTDPRSLELFALRATSPAGPNCKFVLVIDQFEELFTLCNDPGERRAFINLLLASATNGANDANYTASASPLRVVITLRADFYAACAQYPGLREVLSKWQEYIGPMEPKGMRRAIEEPARRGGWSFEPGLVDRILRDCIPEGRIASKNSPSDRIAGDRIASDRITSDRITSDNGLEGAHLVEPGVLPLLSHALLETWKHRRGRVMTLESYAETGGVRNAIARTAETLYHSRLDAGQQTIARRIFLRLADLREGVQNTCRRARLDDLVTSSADDQAIAAVLHVLTEARLVSASEDSIEVAHEALIHEWPALQHWLEEDRESIRIQRMLSDAADAWQRGSQDDSLLYHGSHLAEAGEWTVDHPGELNALEAHFLEASQAMQQNELAQAKQRAEEQARVAARLLRRSMFLTGGLLVMAALAVFSLLAWLGANISADASARQKDTFERQRNAAGQQRDAAVEAMQTAQAGRVEAERQAAAAEQARQQSQAQQQAAGQAVQTAEAARAAAEQDRQQALAAYTQAEIDNGWWLIDHEQYTLAKDQFERALALDPGAVDAHLGRAWAAYRSEDYEAAVASFEAVLQAKPSLLDAGAWNTLGWSYEEQNEYEKARAAFEQQLRLNPNSGDAYFGRGVALTRLGEYQLAADDYRKAVQVDPSFAGQAALYSQMAVAYAHLNDSASEEAAASRAVVLSASQAAGYAGLGWAYYHDHAYDQALAHFSKAIELEPGLVEGYNGLGWSAFDQEDYPAALQYFEQGLALAPTDADLNDGLGSAYYRLENYPQAIAYLEKAIALDDSHAYFTNIAWLGWANLHINHLDPAQAYFERANQMDPQAAGPYQGLGDVSYQRKEMEQALENYQKYLDLVEDAPEEYVVARVKELKGN